MIPPTLRTRELGYQPNGTFHYIHTYKCESENSVDPDIAGIGVMIASVLSTVITIVYILVGWFKNWIRGFPERPADMSIRNMFHSSTRRKDNTPVSTKSQEDFESVILAFSDQQLVTGFALLLSVYIKGDITVYTFRIATSVAWFSSTTHLATLVVLRRYLHEKKLVRYCRIALMIPNAALLLTSQIQSNGLHDFPSWAAVHCIDTKRTPFDIISISFIAVWLVFAFTNRIINVCSQKQSFSDRSWLFELIVHYLKLKPEDEDKGWPTHWQRLDERIRRYSEPRTPSQEFLLCVTLVLFFLVDVMDSLFWEILWLCFSLVYGLTGIAVTWGHCSQPTEDLGTCWKSVLQMGLGQMIPLVLLILPAFTFLESFTVAKSKNGSRRGSDAAVAQETDKDSTGAPGLLEAQKTLQESIQGAQKAIGEFQSRWSLRPGQNPYESSIGKWIATVVYIYLFCLFVTAAALANGAAGITYAGLLIVLLLVYGTYVVSATVDCLIIARALRKRR